MAKVETKKKLNVYIRNLERRDIPKVANWLASKSYQEKNLTDYPVNDQRLLKNQLLKELAVSKLIFARTSLLVAEVNGEILVGFISLKNIDWRNKHLDLQIYLPPEFTNSDLPVLITNQVYNYIFQELSMHKTYHYLTDADSERLKAYQGHKKEPEAILYDYISAGNTKLNLYIFATYRREVIDRN